jgi:hypothetical protein
VVLQPHGALVDTAPSAGTVMVPPSRAGWLGGGYALGALYGIPVAVSHRIVHLMCLFLMCCAMLRCAVQGRSLLYLGATRGMAGFSAVGGIVGGVIQTPALITRRVSS